MITITHHAFNENLSKSIKKLHGRWNDSAKHYEISDIVADKATMLKEKWEGELVTIQIKAKDRLSSWRSAVQFCGYVIAKAWDRDAGANLGQGVSQMSGHIDSGGSMKNWATIVNEGSEFRLQILKSMLAKARTSEKWDVKTLDEISSDDIKEDEDIID